MDQHLGQATLRDGTAVEIRSILPPEPAWANKIDTFLQHKGLPWCMHWRAAFADQCDDLATRFYVLTVDGQPISNIMTVETLGVGILGHVYTDPAWRKKGAASILMRTVTDDFAQRDGIALYLYTDYQGMPWRLYEKFGFEGFVPDVGYMRWIRRPDALKEMFSAQRLQARPAAWRDWPLLECLFLQGQGDWLKNFALKRFGTCDMEGAFLEYRQKAQAPAEACCAVLVNAAGMTMGFGTLLPLDSWPSDYLGVDLYVHPAAASGLDDLLRALHLPEDRALLAWLDAPSGQRRRALEEAGFEVAASLPAALKTDAGSVDLLALRRPAM